MANVPAIILSKNSLLNNECTDIRKPKFVSDHNHSTLPSVAELEEMQQKFTWPKEFYFEFLHTGDQNDKNDDSGGKKSQGKEAKTTDSNKEKEKHADQEQASPAA